MEENIKLLYPSVDDEVIALVLGQVQSFVLDYCNIAEIPSTLEGVVLEMCKQDLNKMLSQGISSQSAGGSSVSYEQDYTQNVYKRLKKHKRIKTI